jgi:hypothetical protein
LCSEPIRSIIWQSTAHRDPNAREIAREVGELLKEERETHLDLFETRKVFEMKEL